MSLSGIEREERAAAPHARWLVAFRERDLGELVIDRPGKLRLEPVADQYPRARSVRVRNQPQRMIGAEDHRIAAVEAKLDLALLALALAIHLDCPESGRLDID